MNVITVLVNGAFGKMGALAAATLKNQVDFQVVAECGRADDLALQLKRYRPDVVLDLTVASAALTNLALIIDAGCRPVIGTSGLNAARLAPYQQQCQQQRLGGIIAPNFSMAAMVMMRCVAMAAEHFSSVEIIEMHHAGKVDAPSGTAIKTAEIIHAHAPERPSTDLTTPRGTCVEGVMIHSVRMHGVLAKQQVLFGNSGEQLLIEAHTLDRQAYMPGVLFACRKVMHLTELVYGLEKC